MGDRFGLPVSQATVLNHLDSLNCADRQSPNYNSRKYQAEVRELRDLYEPILRQAELDDPEAPSTGKRGRTKQSKATNLIGRLTHYTDVVWRFMTQPDMPFTNNLAEQAVRMPGELHAAGENGLSSDL